MLKIQKTILAGTLSLAIVAAIGATAAFAAPASSRSETASPALSIVNSSLSAEEAASLLYMREEEKLARDVYNALYAVSGQPVFSNIAASEQTHMDAIKVLLDRYGLPDPALGPGQFSNPDLQALYDQLVAQGSRSLTDALKVGVAIEELDIRDLQTRMDQTDNADIQLVYSRLMIASNNHLQAFTAPRKIKPVKAAASATVMATAGGGR